MEKQDLSKLLIADSEYYNEFAAYSGFLKRHNIETIEQLLNGDLEKLRFNGHKMQGQTYVSLSSFIRILKHVYYDEPLLNDVYLDDSIDLEKTALYSHGQIALDGADAMDSINIGSFIGNGIAEIALNRFIRQCNNEQKQKEKENIPVEKVKLIDFFRWIPEHGYTSLFPFAKLYLEAYEKNKEMVNEDTETMQFLKGQLASLIKMKSDIDGQINDIKKKMEEISSSKGGMKA